MNTPTDFEESYVVFSTCSCLILLRGRAVYLAAKEACPKNEKFLSTLKSNIEKMFDEQQIVNSGQVQMPNDIANNKPRSYLNNITVEKQLQIMLFLPEVV